MLQARVLNHGLLGRDFLRSFPAVSFHHPFQARGQGSHVPDLTGQVEELLSVVPQGRVR